MLLRIIIIFVIMSIAAIISSKLSGIAIVDLFLLVLVISPLAILQKKLHTEKSDFIYSGSIIFRKYNWLFRLCSLIFGIAIFVGLYHYGQIHGFGIMVIYILIASIIQGAYYAFIRLIVPGEIFLILMEIAGLVLFYTFAF